jgi:hypothetical protein
MSTNIKLKRSAIQGKVPTTADLDLGELAINTFDGKLFMKKDDGTEDIVDVTSGGFTDQQLLNQIKNVDGTGSGLDADLLDGQEGTYYLDWTNVTNKPDPTVTLTGAVTGSATMTDLGSISIATTATADPTLTINGDASGSATFTNLGNATLSLTIVDDSHNHVISNIDGLQNALDSKTTESYVDTQISNLVDSSPATLDTLNELAAALGDDPNFATTVSNQISTKANSSITISAGGGLTGGGNLTTNRTISHADTSAQASLTSLTGANVVSDIDLDTYGHVTNLSTRAMTPGDIGAQPAGTYNTIIGTDSDINTSGSTIIDNIFVTDGVITSMGARTLTLSDLGYTGATNADNYNGWDLLTDGNSRGRITSGENVNIVGGTNVTLGYSSTNNTITINAAGTPPNNATITLSAGAGLTGGGNFTTDQATNETITVNHADTSTQGSVNNSGGTVIQDVTLDGYGHVTNLNSKNLSASDVGALGVNDKAADADLLDGNDSTFFTSYTNSRIPSGITTNGRIATLTTSYNTDINQSSDVVIEWDTPKIVDDGFAHSTASNPSRLTISDAGRYRIYVSLAYDSGGERVNPRIRIRKNGSIFLDGEGLSGYIRAASGHNEGSNSIMVVEQFAAGDYIEVITDQIANSGTCTLRGGQSIFIVEPVQQISAGKIAQFIDSTGGTDLNTSGIVPFDSEIKKDSAFVHSNTTNPSRIEVANTGWYRITYNVTHNNDDGNNDRVTMRTRVRKNGSTFLDGSGTRTYLRDYAYGEFAHNGTTFVAQLNAGDYVEVFGDKTSGSSGGTFTVADETQLLIEQIEEISSTVVNAEKFDGLNSSQFLRSDTSDTFTTLSGNEINIGSGVELRESTDRADLLQITSNTSSWGGIQIRNSSNEGRWSFMTNGGTAGIYDDENSDWAIQMLENSEVRLYFNGSEKLNTTSTGVTVNGRVGIGTNSPSQELDVNGDVVVSGQLAVGTSDFSTDLAYQRKIKISGSGPCVYFEETDENQEWALSATSGNFNIRNATTGDGVFYVASNNNVGIGTSNPAAKLHTSLGNSGAATISSAGVAGFFENSGNASLQVAAGTGNSAYLFLGDAAKVDATRIAARDGFTQISATGASDYMRFDTNGFNERMRITATGNVGIGTSNPSSTLDVNGSLSKNSGSFKIDHPVKPDTHHLVHSFIEGPQADNLYRGKVTLVDGAATVNLDEAGRMTEGTFVALNGNVQCFTTNEDGWTQVRGKVEGNILTIEAQDPTCTDEVSWLVIGERHDQHMIDANWTNDQGRVITEPKKAKITNP